MIRHRHIPPEASPSYLLPTIQLINLLSTFINHHHYPSPQHTLSQTDIVACSSVVSIVSYYLHPRLSLCIPRQDLISSTLVQPALAPLYDSSLVNLFSPASTLLSTSRSHDQPRSSSSQSQGKHRIGVTHNGTSSLVFVSHLSPHLPFDRAWKA